MPNTLRIVVENPDDLLDSGLYGSGALVRVQTSATEAGAFADISGTGSDPTVLIVANTRSYIANDPNGIASSWYRTRYENAGASRVSDWTPAFQTGDETGGLLCSLYDVQQELGVSYATPGSPTAAESNRDEILLEKIRQVSYEIERYCGRWLAPRPTNPASTKTLLFDVERPFWTRELTLSSEQRIVGIRTLSALGVATVSQPETGGTYTSATVADVLLRPRPTADGPASRIVFNYPATGAISTFWPGYNTVSVTGSFGPAEVPPDIQAVATIAAVRRFSGKGTGAPTVSLGPDGGVVMLTNFSPDMMKTLDAYRVFNVA